MITLAKTTTAGNTIARTIRDMGSADLLQVSAAFENAGMATESGQLFAEYLTRGEVNARYAGLFA